MKAKAAVFMGANKPFEVREFPVTETPAGYGRAELIASGICGTDVHFHSGRLSVAAPTVIGHEFVGRLVDCDEKEATMYGLKKGDNVIADIAVPCGECLLCKTGDNANCVHMQVTNGGSIEVAPYLYGGYTEVNYTPLTNLIKIPDELDPTMASVFACPGPTGMHAFALARQAGVVLENVDTAVVQGLGPVGMYAVMYLKAIGVKKVYSIVARTNDDRVQIAKKLGAEKVFSLEWNTPEEINMEIIASSRERLGVDLVFEASGAPAAIPQGFDLLRNRGVYLVPGQYSNSGGINIQPQLITFKALHIIGASQYSVCDVKAYLQFLCDHKELHEYIMKLANRYKVEEINEAMADAKAGNNIKTLLVK